MSEWKEVVLEDITSRIGDGLHGTPKYDTNGDYFFINGNNLKDGKILIKPDTKKVTKEEAIKHERPLSDRTILLSINGTIGNLAFYNYEKCMLGKSACYININEDVSVPFMYYHFLSEEFQLYIEMIATGTTIPNVPLKGIRQYTFNLPSTPEQNAIAEVLSSLDDKIDLLHRQNQTLEQMAETLFRQWFVEEADEGWDKGVLGDYIFTNKNSVRKDYPNLEIEYLDTGSLTTGRWGNFQPFLLSEAPSRAKRLVKHNDILYSTVRPNQLHYGIVRNPIENLVVSTGFCVITCHSLSPYFVYYYLTDKGMTEYLHSIAEGSTSAYPSLKPSDIEALEFSIAPSDVLEKFDRFVDDAWKRIESNQTQIRTLTALRVTLLPKLMSGEVRVQSQRDATFVGNNSTTNPSSVGAAQKETHG
ncbi:restriction endonuclease subunit S [Maribacter sp. 2307ULW6-5]|uniref:restriction endonuclease subunit S n=1 Tax=Maribacter sp. 2307ULW6-5 TaxID=3386275 RepID=UPI0039BC7F07